MSDLIPAGIERLAKRLNLTLQEAIEIQEKLQELPENKATWETLEQLAKGMKSLRAKEL